MGEIAARILQSQKAPMISLWESPSRDHDRRASGGWAPAALVDSHVHLHRCFEPAAFLDAAARNFRRSAAALQLPFLSRPVPGCLLLAEGRGEHAFRRLCEEAEKSGGAWSFEATEEPGALLAVREGQDGETGDTLVLIAGRQIRTYEGLEVLALATTEDFPDGLSFNGTLERVHWSGALPVVPWGFGKWWGERGGIVERLLAAPEREAVFLGDNAGRPGIAPRPALFGVAEKQGVPVLPGSDPLPLPEHVARPGSYGFLLDLLESELDPLRPAATLSAALRRVRQLGERPKPFGRCSGFLDFCRDQSALRMRHPSAFL